MTALPQTSWRHEIADRDLLRKERFGAFFYHRPTAVFHPLTPLKARLLLGATERSSDLIQNLKAFLLNLPAETLYVGVVLALLAIVVRSRRSIVVACFGALALYLLIFNAMNNLPLDDPLFYWIQSRFWQQAHMVVFFLAGVGFHRGEDCPKTILKPRIHKLRR